jgi:hypothetical protein
MWGKRRKRRTRLERQLALAQLEDALGRVQEERHEEEGEPEAVPYPGAVPGPPLPPDRARGSGLRDADVPVDNSAGPEPSPADSESEPEKPPPGQLPEQRTKGSSRHRSFG